MKVPKPFRVQEPYCKHSPMGFKQPASACRYCKDGPELKKWKDDWAAWLAENPDSPEARWVRDNESPSN